MGENSTRFTLAETENLEEVLLRLDKEFFNVDGQNAIQTPCLHDVLPKSYRQLPDFTQSNSYVADQAYHLELENTNVYCNQDIACSKITEINSLKFNSPDAIIDGAGWNCHYNCAKLDKAIYKPGVFFSDTDQCENLISLLESLPRTRCILAKPIYVVDSEWLKNPSDLKIGSNHILCKIENE